jgi:hypothetical protein
VKSGEERRDQLYNYNTLFLPLSFSLYLAVDVQTRLCVVKRDIERGRLQRKRRQSEENEKRGHSEGHDQIAETPFVLLNLDCLYSY